MTVWLIAAGGPGDPLLPQFRQYKAAVFSYKEGGDIRGIAREDLAASFEGKPYLDDPRRVVNAGAAGKYARELGKIRDEVKRGDYLDASLKGARSSSSAASRSTPTRTTPSTTATTATSCAPSGRPRSSLKLSVRLLRT
ncbi:hypothetical protein [Streptomyces sp. NBC_01546]|uniref:hypothetical protein n=1 Tax=Streptomyces sp. NBC_01546 TaxID=2975872 RepID=UPI00386A14C9